MAALSNPARRVLASLALAGILVALPACAGRTPTGAATQAPAASAASAVVAPSEPTRKPEPERARVPLALSALASRDIVKAEPLPVPQPRVVALGFDSAKAMAHVRKFADGIGVRKGGTDGEWQGAVYARDYLRSLGYTVTIQNVPLPNGRTTHNVVAHREGRTPWTLLLGGHMDSKAPAPGANDNASGSAVVLELARTLKDRDTAASFTFVLFGTEEMIDSNGDHHHYGSRWYASHMNASERARLSGMLAIDMVGYGTDFRLRTMAEGPQSLRGSVLAWSAVKRVGLGYMSDPSRYGYSDHEPFQRAGFPAAWLEWRDDPTYHTAADKASHVQEPVLETTGEFVASYCVKVTEAELKALHESAR